MPEAEISKDKLNIVDCLISLEFASSRGDAKKLIAGGGVRVNDKPVDSIDFTCPAETFVLKKGKKNIIKVIVK